MKIVKKIILLFVFSIVITSCEKVIDIDLNSASPKYVIEGDITNAGGVNTVKITRTKNFDEDNNFEEVTGANVTVTDNVGNTETLAMTSPGIYQTSTLMGIPGHTYYLNIDVNGEQFTSVSTMPYPVSLDTAYVFDFTDFGDTLKLVFATYTDSAGIPNYYRHSLIVNGKRDKSIDISDDQASDGVSNTRGLFYRDDEGEGLKAGDSVTIEMLCIEKPVHLYFFSLNQTISQSAATPANPISNITGGALGYFSAHTFESTTFVVQ